MKKEYEVSGQRAKDSIISKTVMNVTAIFVAAFIILTFATVQIFSVEMKKRIVSDQQIIVEKIVNTVNYPLNSLIAPIITLSDHKSVLKLLRKDETMYSSEWMKCIRDINTYLTNVNTFSDYIMDIAVIQPDSNVVYSMSNVLDRDYDYCGQQWFKDAVKSKGLIKYALPHGSDHYYSSFKGNDHTVTAIYPVENANKLMGYIIVEVDIARTSNIFSPNSTENDSGFLLISSEGKIIIDYDKKRSKSAYVSDQIYQYLTGDISKPQIIDNNLYIAKQLSSTGWYVVSETDYLAITKPASNIIKVVFVLLAGCSVLLLFLVRIVTKRMKRPIDNLIERISSYDGSSSIALSDIEQASGEILTIRTKFEEMADKINNLINDVYIAQMRRRDMELEALMNQINPHFLYNVLQLIQTKAVLSGELEIEDMITSLGSMLRYTMDRTREKVMVQDEMEYINHYLVFYKARFFNMFDYSIECEDELKKCKVLKFIFQPIVENCFKHGFKNKKENGLIKIKIFSEGADIVFQIYDNGRGISPQRLQMIKQNLENGSDGESIGIVNTHTRIQLIYGKEYGLSIDSQPEEYTQVTVRIKNEDRTSDSQK